MSLHHGRCNQTVINYASFAATPIYSSHASIYDRPASVITYNGSGTRIAETDYSYDGSTLAASGVGVGHDSTYYSTSQTVRGNATSMSKWVNTSSTSLAWNYTYDDTGQELSMSDPKSNGTSYSYADSYAGCGSASKTTNAYLTKITDAKGFTQSFTYRYCDGELNSATDRNSKTTSYSYSDSLDRLTGISYPDGGSTTYGYGSNACSQPSSTTVVLTGTSNYTETASFDGACRLTEKSVTSDPVAADNTVTTYDGLGRVWTVSNPYRSTSDTSYGVSTTTYDDLGRTTSVEYADGSTATTNYSGDTSTVSDPAGKTRTLGYDALGRVNSVNEAGLYSTSYAYNVFDQIKTVTQGSQTRTFTYDSLSRLYSAANPESGTVSYTYPTSNTGACSGDPSDVCTRTDARGISTTYTYNDPLNRLTAKTYSDGTPTAQYSYDLASVWGVGTTNALGRLVLRKPSADRRCSPPTLSRATTPWGDPRFTASALLSIAACLHGHSATTTTWRATSPVGPIRTDIP